LENVEKWAAKVETPLYALDDQSALKVIDGNVEVISMGVWKLFNQP
jgi:dipeptidase E